ncbi:MAG: DEAD/DEAH box helicase, partial [Verrucomicrobiota bacterium]
ITGFIFTYYLICLVIDNMVEFDKLRKRQSDDDSHIPVDLFRRLPKPEGINDLYNSQAEVLDRWYENRNTQKDVVLKLHTGGGKTLVGLLMALSTLKELKEPVLYLAPTVQLVNQTIAKAEEFGIPVVAYQKGMPLNEDFLNGTAIMVATYRALFHGRSLFGVQGDSSPKNVAAVILDDAHAAFPIVRDSFTITIKSKENREQYEQVAGLFRKAFIDMDKVGTFDDILSGGEVKILEVPYWSWLERLDAVRENLKASSITDGLEWPLLRDHLHLCHALISRESFSITPILPLVNQFPTFTAASRRIYMSATMADDTEIIRTFDVPSDAVKNALTSRSLAGVSERMIMVPALIPSQFDFKDTVVKLIKSVSASKRGVVILAPSERAAKNWEKEAIIPRDTNHTEELINKLQNEETYGPVAFANRYDGIDLPGNSCRLLIVDGLPSGTSNYELFRSSVLYGGGAITRMIAQRIEQGLGRGARGSGDHCVVLLLGNDLTGWLSKQTNFRFLTDATRVQTEIGIEISKEISDEEDFLSTLNKCYSRDKSWLTYHAETLANSLSNSQANEQNLQEAKIERKAFNLWQDGFRDKAITRIESFLEKADQVDDQSAGWLSQLAARIAFTWENKSLSTKWQRQAYMKNRSLLKPSTKIEYQPIPLPGAQARSIVEQITSYTVHMGFLHNFEEVVALLNGQSSSNQFEEALKDFGRMIGYSTERCDLGQGGPDVLWLLSAELGMVIEAKNRKKQSSGLKKEDHGQLLVSGEWFEKNYPNVKYYRISVLPENKSSKNAVADQSRALTYEGLNLMIADARTLFSELCSTQLDGDALLQKSEGLLMGSKLTSDKIVNSYCEKFKA